MFNLTYWRLIVVPSLCLGSHQRTSRCRHWRRRRSRCYFRPDGDAIVMEDRPAFEVELRAYGLEPGDYCIGTSKFKLARMASSGLDQARPEPCFDVTRQPFLVSKCGSRGFGFGRNPSRACTSSKSGSRRQPNEPARQVLAESSHPPFARCRARGSVSKRSRLCGAPSRRLIF